MTQTIEQFTARVRELEEENARLKKHQCTPVCIFHEGDEREELKKQLAAAQEENGRLENQVLARDAELWGRTQEILGLKDQLAKAEQRVAEWQPIETAPKDGRELILLLTPSKWPQVAYSNTWWISGFSVENKPTHWMPLPKAPNGASS